MKTDIERLHDVVESDYGPDDRRVGKTVAHCHELCGVLEVGDSDLVLCLVPRMERAWHIVKTLEWVFAEHGIKVVKGHVFHRLLVEVPDVGVRELRFVRQDDDRQFCGLDCTVVEFHD